VALAHGSAPKDAGRGDEEMNGGRKEGLDPRPQGATVVPSGNGTKRENEGTEASVKLGTHEITDKDLEDIGREVPEAFRHDTATTKGAATMGGRRTGGGRSSTAGRSARRVKKTKTESLSKLLSPYASPGPS
jgi:hypothetical protein